MVKMRGSEEKSEQEHKQQDHMWIFRPTLTWMIYPKSSSLVTSNLTLMTLRYISRSRQRTIDSCLRQVDDYLKHVSEWCWANHLLINPEKTKFVLFGVRQLISKLPSNITVPWSRPSTFNFRQRPWRHTWLEPDLRWPHRFTNLLSYVNISSSK